MNPAQPDGTNDASDHEARKDEIHENQLPPLARLAAAETGALTALERHALTELVNIGVSRAANSLRELMDEEVQFAVPSVGIVSHAEADAIIRQSNPAPLTAVRQAFQGEFCGCALLIFPEPNSLELVRAVARSALRLEDVADLEQEALAEIGNIILNGCMATIADLLEHSLVMSLPEIIRDSGLNFFNLPPSCADDSVLCIYINFSLTGREVSGGVAIVMGVLSLTPLRALVPNFIRRTSTARVAAARAQLAASLAQASAAAEDLAAAIKEIAALSDHLNRPDA